ncbi:MAG: 1-deoxy-D-xylulose-5-phosphate synthase [Actinobacteria bacterium]|nr:1-deoxy-D-xylulose-5-phosphate synthase [Actinomycetota bacterium]
MLLETISSPADLRGLDDAQLAQLASEIRDRIVQVVARNSGHLGSNLGVVELTLALHRVFDSPTDRILWDTGHLAYVHKLLTGRNDDFDSIRQGGGLSGYPSRAESEHDFIENSHASTVLSYAHGLAMAEDLRIDAAARTGEKVGRRRETVAVIGDGALTGGMAYEALNNLGHSGRKAVIILNDNGRSYAPTVGRLTASVSRLRLHPRYLRQRRRAEEVVRKVPGVGQHLVWGLAGARAGLRELFEPPIFFETLGVRYSGPFDGHDIEIMEEALRNAAEFDGPVVVHVLTTKGKGYPPAEQDEEKCLHDAGGFNPEIGPQPSGKPAKPSYTGAFTEAILKEGESHPELVAITAAMPGSTGLLPFQERFPERFVDVGIAEQHAVTAAAGMAMGGLRPVVALYSTFLSRAFDQANLDVGLHELPVVFCLDRAGITGPDGASHHGVLDMVLLSKVPGMTMFAPSSYQEVGVMFHDAVELCDGPASLRWSRTAAPMVEDHEVGVGLHARKAREGGDICLIGVGKMLWTCLAVADALAADGIEATVWDPRVVKPLDPEMLDDAAGFDHVVTVEDGLREGGIGAAIADEVARRTQDTDRSPRVAVLGTPTRFLTHGDPDAILAELGLDAAGVEASARALLDGRPSTPA